MQGFQNYFSLLYLHVLSLVLLQLSTYRFETVLSFHVQINYNFYNKLFTVLYVRVTYTQICMAQSFKQAYMSGGINQISNTKLNSKYSYLIYLVISILYHIININIKYQHMMVVVLFLLWLMTLQLLLLFGGVSSMVGIAPLSQ